MLSLRQVRVIALLGIFATSACTDRATTDLVAPTVATATLTDGRVSLPGRSGATSTSPTGLSLRAIWWDQQLRSDVVVIRTIGPSGGVITIPQTGLTVVFPAGALTKPVDIKITADPRYVAYRMEPSGTRFLKDVTVTQLLSATELFGRPLQSGLYAAYIADDGISLSGKLPVLEIEPSHTIFSALQPFVPDAQVWVIRHFSRYILASG